MLEYEWGDPSAVMLDGAEEDPVNDSERGRQFFDNYSNNFNETLFHPFSHQQPSFYDPRYYGPTSYPVAPMPPPQPHASVIGLDMLASGGGYMVVPKAEEPAVDFTARLGLNLGGRTYFSAADEDFVSRLYRRSSGRPGETGNTPRCQAEGCGADLTNAKHYHRRHKVCEYHSKAATVVAGGLTQRFCQQCSRFHLLCEFDNGKRSCRKRLADHNRRRRKSHHQPTQDHPKTPQLEASGAPNSSSDGFARSPSESVTAAISPPRMSLDCFRGRPYQAPSASSASSSSSIFFSG